MPGSTNGSRLVDCFMINDELDLLEFRLRYLSEFVDKFVIVEAPFTFTGRPKPLHFSDNRGRFAEWDEKIEHVVASVPADVAKAFDRENAQRSAMRDAVAGAGPQDTVLLSDVDEFPYPWVLRAVRSAGRLQSPLFLEMAHSIYWADWELPGGGESLTVACQRQHLDDQKVRNNLGDSSIDWTGYVQHVVRNAGRHVSFLGGPSRVRQKLSDYSHEAFAEPEFSETRYLEKAVTKRVHFRIAVPLRRAPLDDPVVEAMRRHLPDAVSDDPPRRTTGSWTFAAQSGLRRRAAARLGWSRARPLLVLSAPVAPLLVPAVVSRSRARTRPPAWPPRVYHDTVQPADDASVAPDG